MIVANGAGMFKVGEKDHDQNNFLVSDRPTELSQLVVM